MEVRFSDLTAAPADQDKQEMIVEGYAAVYDSKTLLFSDINWGDQYEIIDAGAFAGCDMSDVVFRYNHTDKMFLFARTKNNSLILQPDEKGLRMIATLADTQQGRDLYKLIQRGDITKMSFAFDVSADSYDEAANTRHIEKVGKLYDVAAVDFPAYEDTDLQVFRNTVNSAQEKRQKLEKAATLRRKLIALTYC